MDCAKLQHQSSRPYIDSSINKNTFPFNNVCAKCEPNDHRDGGTLSNLFVRSNDVGSHYPIQPNDSRSSVFFQSLRSPITFLVRPTSKTRWEENNALRNRKTLSTLTTQESKRYILCLWIMARTMAYNTTKPRSYQHYRPITASRIVMVFY